MSGLRIRSEAAADLWPESWLPRAAGAQARVADTGALVTAMAAALSALFERSVRALPASEDEADALDGGGGARLAALLLSLRLGGGVEKGAPSSRVSGAVWARFRAQIGAVAAGAAAWPKGVQRLVLLVDVAGVEDLLEVFAPQGAAADAGQDGAAPDGAAAALVAAALAAVPMRLRVELAAEMVNLAVLLPLRVGQVLAIQPVAEMRLRMGDHAVGRVTLQAQADGRQEATLVAVDVDALNDRGERT